MYVWSVWSVCMYVSMCVSIYVCMHVYMHIYVANAGTFELYRSRRLSFMISSVCNHAAIHESEMNHLVSCICMHKCAHVHTPNLCIQPSSGIEAYSCPHTYASICPRKRNRETLSYFWYWWVLTFASPVLWRQTCAFLVLCWASVQSFVPIMKEFVHHLQQRVLQ
jgi:hypothetical protein